MGATKAGKVVLKRNRWMNIRSETLLGLKKHNDNNTFLSPKSSSWFSQCLDVYGLLLKEEWTLHRGKHGPVPTFLF